MLAHMVLIIKKSDTFSLLTTFNLYCGVCNIYKEIMQFIHFCSIVKEVESTLKRLSISTGNDNVYNYKTISNFRHI